MDTSTPTLHGILTTDLHLYAYKMTLTQQLLQKKTGTVKRVHQLHNLTTKSECRVYRQNHLYGVGSS